MVSTASQIYRVQNGSIDFVCPKCAFSKSVDVERLLQRNYEVQVKIKCRCHNLLTAVLDRRNHRRKPTDIQGKFFYTPKDRPITDGEIKIKNLSYAGLGFDLLGDSHCAFGVGNVLRVHFKLFPNANFLIKKEAIIRQMNDLRVNASFPEPLKNNSDFFLKLFFYS
jgi:hypothetical protein